MLDDIIAIAVIVLILCGAVAYIIKAKRAGQKCIGCPYSKTCSGKCGCNQSSDAKDEDNK